MSIPKNRWEEWRDQKLSEYPCPHGKWRYDLELSHPRYNIEDVPVERNPHSLGDYTGHTCFYRSNDWSTIFPVSSDGLGLSLKMLVESGNTDPLWGERIALFSTSSSFHDDSWGTNEANKFAFFRNQWWRITWHQFLHDESEIRAENGRVNYPLMMQLPTALPVIPYQRERELQRREHRSRMIFDIGMVANLDSESTDTVTMPPIWLNVPAQTKDFNWIKEGF